MQDQLTVCSKRIRLLHAAEQQTGTTHCTQNSAGRAGSQRTACSIGSQYAPEVGSQELTIRSNGSVSDEQWMCDQWTMAEPSQEDRAWIGIKKRASYSGLVGVRLISAERPQWGRTQEIGTWYQFREQTGSWVLTSRWDNTCWMPVIGFNKKNTWEG